jgi:DNA-binding transcriptional regulator YhcF (GntR family)
MRLNLDPASPLPLYHQLAEGIRYQIATGVLEPGAALPSLRDAARRWGVNLHTVRHAYASLATEGLVRTQAPHGTVVVGRRAAAAQGAPKRIHAAGPDRSSHGRSRSGSQEAREADRFLLDMLREAASRYGLTSSEVRHRLAFLGAAVSAAPPVYVIECSETQAADLALQVSADWQASAQGWSLERPGEPPTGVIVATYFHYNDIRTRWAERSASVHFVAIHPDPALAPRLQQFGRRGRRTRVLVCERDHTMAGNIAADLRCVLPSDRFELVPTVESSVGSALATADPNTAVLFSPREWGSLIPAQRADPRAIEIRYLIDPKDLTTLGQELGWEPRELPSAQHVPARRSRSASI